MKITIRQAQNISNSPIFGKTLPVSVSYKFAKLGKALIEELKMVNEHRHKLIENCGGVLKEDKTQFTFSNLDDASKFQTEINELLDIEIEVPFEPVPVDKLGSIELTPNELLMLEPILVME